MVGRDAAEDDAATCPIADLAAREGCVLGQGLTSAQAKKKLRAEGPNEVQRPPRPTLLPIFLGQLRSVVLVLLVASALASMAVAAISPQRAEPHAYATGLAILVIVLVNAGTATWLERRAGDALASVSRLSQASCWVLRDGVALQVASASVVCGDLVILTAGDVVPADIRLTEVHNLQVCEAVLTGEMVGVAKTLQTRPRKASDPVTLLPETMVFGGCGVTAGSARGIVVCTGNATRLGRIVQLTAGEGGLERTTCSCLTDALASETPMQRSLGRLARRVGMSAMAVCAMTFVIGMALDRAQPDDADSPAWLFLLLLSTASAAAAVPGIIPVCVMVSMAVACEDLVKHRVLVRKLAAMEMLGCVSAVCSGTTGVLTEGSLAVVSAWSGGVYYDIRGDGLAPPVCRADGSTDSDAREDPGLRTLLLAAALCSTGTNDGLEDPEASALAAATLAAAAKVGLGAHIVDEYCPIQDISYTTSLGMSMAVTSVSDRSTFGPGGMSLERGWQSIAAMKGAPQRMLQLCTELVEEDGTIGVLKDRMRSNILEAVNVYSQKALRVLAVAAVPVSQLPSDGDSAFRPETLLSDCRENIRLLGLLAFGDPLRLGVVASIARARDAGIRIIVVSSEPLATVLALARSVRLMDDCENEDVALDCEGLRPGGRCLADEALLRLTAGKRIFAGATPEDKLALVRLLQRQGLVTATLAGAGPGEAPALLQADVGVAAAGTLGAEVSRAASDLVLQDGSFCSFMNAVMAARSVYAAIQRLVAFILSVHMAEALQIFFCLLADLPSMRTPLQILALTLVTDLPPAIALGTDPSDDAVLRHFPRRKGEPVGPGWLWTSVLLNSLVLCVSVLAVYVAALLHFCNGDLLQDSISRLPGHQQRLVRARTVAFIALLWAVNVRAFQSSSWKTSMLRDTMSNKTWLVAGGLNPIFVYVTTLMPGFSDAVLGLDATKIGGQGWAMAMLAPLATLALGEGCRLLVRRQVDEHERRKRTVEVPDATCEVDAADRAEGPAASVTEGDLGAIDVVLGKAYSIPPSLPLEAARGTPRRPQPVECGSCLPLVASPGPFRGAALNW